MKISLHERLMVTIEVFHGGHGVKRRDSDGAKKRAYADKCKNAAAV